MHRRAYIPGSQNKRNRDALARENRQLRETINHLGEFAQGMAKKIRDNETRERTGRRGLMHRVKSLFARKVGAK